MGDPGPGLVRGGGETAPRCQRAGSSLTIAFEIISFGVARVDGLGRQEVGEAMPECPREGLGLIQGFVLHHFMLLGMHLLGME
jgi:hypothetical protein